MMTMVTNPWVRGTAVVIAAVLAIAGTYAPAKEQG
jgi:hypothetical protein